MAENAEQRSEVTELARRTGAQAVLGGVLLVASVAAELIHPVQTSDGTTTEPLLHTLYLAAWLADVDPFHDLGFFVFFGSWIVLGIGLWMAAGVGAPLRSN